MINRLHSGGIITNYHCSASCGHCLYKSSPKRDNSYISGELLRKILQKGADLGCRSYHIGGGEPFLDTEALIRTVKVFREEGIGIDYLETNASWYRSSESTIEILSELRKSGCRTVMVSVCPFHIEYIPMKKVDGIIDACRQMGMNYFLWQDQYYSELSVLDPKKTHSFEELTSRYGDDYLVQAAGRFGLTLNGRALENLKQYLPTYPAEEIIRMETGVCFELESTGHFHFDLYGNYIPPGCTGLALDFMDLDNPLQDKSYPHFLLLLEQGISGLYEYAVGNYGYYPESGGYVSKCDLCYHIRKHIVTGTESDTRISDLKPREFYLFD